MPASEGLRKADLIHDLLDRDSPVFCGTGSLAVLIAPGVGRAALGDRRPFADSLALAVKDRTCARTRVGGYGPPRPKNASLTSWLPSRALTVPSNRTRPPSST